MCESIQAKDLPQPIDVEALRQDACLKSGSATSARDDGPPIVNLATEKDFAILPQLHRRYDHLKDILSVERNEFLKARWDLFLENQPQNWLHIVLYQDLRKRPTYFPRRFSLTGNPYDKHSYAILRPMPYAEDPRQHFKRKNHNGSE